MLFLQKKLEKKIELKNKKFMVENEINEIGKEFNIDDFDSNLVNNVISKT